jgi:ketosteroid isomerase-like protein
MKFIASFLVTIFGVAGLYAQSDLRKLVDTEHAFAQLAADKDTRTAFLANMSDDALIFNPDATKAKPFWEARAANKSLLSWAPNYADISSNGILGYTTGNWEYRAKGKDDTPAAFGEFITLWLRQPDGRYKFVIDIGVGHPKPERYSTEWVTSTPRKSERKARSRPTNDAETEFYQLVAAKGIAKAYERFADENIRSYREDKLPFLGKKNVIKLLKAYKSEYSFAKRSSSFRSDDISYNLNTYTKTQGGKVVEKGNFLQIWKFYDGRWHIVLDIFKPVP